MKKSKKNNEMTLGMGDHFKLDIQNIESPLAGVNIYVRNLSINKVKVTTDGDSVLITVEEDKGEKK